MGASPREGQTMSKVTAGGHEGPSFAEAALRLGGKGEDEVRRLGAMDRAHEQLGTFGTPEQKRRFLPRLASGAVLSAFALTEPCAGSDLTALRTTAVEAGDAFEVTGEKLFITNVVPGRTIGVVAVLNGRPAV